MASEMTSSGPGEELTASQEILDAQKELSEMFDLFDDWTDKYQCIIDFGRQADPFPEDWKTEANRLDGCQSQVWMVTTRRDDLLEYSATSDSAIVAGLIAMLLSVYSNRKPSDILATPPEFIKDLDLSDHLSPTRSNGLHAMIQRIRHFAVEAMINKSSAEEK